jgi:hypothetical protein
MNDFVEVQPDAARVINSLRDTGYSLETSIADLVDNSIAAGARRIAIRLEMDHLGDVQVSIADDGCGMDRTTLTNAMRYGSPSHPDPARLGKFGLGLKTASTAFCRLLEVNTRDSAGGEVLSACWDLDEVARRNAWMLQFKTPGRDAIALLDEAAPSHSGTVVVWRKVDRFFGRDYKDPSGGHAKRALGKRESQLCDHLGVTFQRFLDGSARNTGGRLAITVNDKAVEPWDPFCPSEQATDTVTNTTLDIDVIKGGRTEKVPCTIRVVILPAQVEFSSTESYKRARVRQEYQGIYVYRHDRLLQYGTWLGMYTPHGSHNMLRVELSFDYRLDDAFSVPVDRSTIHVDSELAEYIDKHFLQVPVKEAEERRVRGLVKKRNREPVDMHKGSNQSIGQVSESVKQPTLTVVDQAKGDVELVNDQGKVIIKLPVRTLPETEGVFIHPVPELQEGLLFKPALLNGQLGIELNMSHEYYRRVYLPHQKAGGAIQGIDMLLWALCVAENNYCTKATSQIFREIRYEISRNLRSLVEDLPDPVLEADE